MASTEQGVHAQFAAVQHGIKSLLATVNSFPEVDDYAGAPNITDKDWEAAKTKAEQAQNDQQEGYLEISDAFSKLDNDILTKVEKQLGESFQTILDKFHDYELTRLRVAYGELRELADHSHYGFVKDRTVYEEYRADTYQQQRDQIISELQRLQSLEALKDLVIDNDRPNGAGFQIIRVAADEPQENIKKMERMALELQATKSALVEANNERQSLQNAQTQENSAIHDLEDRIKSLVIINGIVEEELRKERNKTKELSSKSSPTRSSDTAGASGVSEAAGIDMELLVKVIHQSGQAYRAAILTYQDMIQNLTKTRTEIVQRLKASLASSDSGVAKVIEDLQAQIDNKQAPVELVVIQDFLGTPPQSPRALIAYQGKLKELEKKKNEQSKSPKGDSHRDTEIQSLEKELEDRKKEIQKLQKRDEHAKHIQQHLQQHIKNSLGLIRGSKIGQNGDSRVFVHDESSELESEAGATHSHNNTEAKVAEGQKLFGSRGFKATDPNFLYNPAIPYQEEDQGEDDEDEDDIIYNLELETCALRRQNSEYVDKIHELAEELQVAKEENEAAAQQEHAHGDEDEPTVTQARYDRLMGRYEDLRNQNRQQASKIRDLELQIEESTNAAQAAEEQTQVEEHPANIINIGYLRDRIARLTQDNDEQAQLIRDQAQEIERLTEAGHFATGAENKDDDIDALSYQTLQQQNAEQRRTIEHLETRIDRLKRDNATQDQAIEDLNNHQEKEEQKSNDELDENERQIKALNDRIDELKEQLEDCHNESWKDRKNRLLREARERNKGKGRKRPANLISEQEINGIRGRNSALPQSPRSPRLRKTVRGPRIYYGVYPPTGTRKRRKTTE